MDFLILPDCPSAGGIADSAVHCSGSQTILHGSGRPWLVGRWEEGEVALVTAGARRLAVFGRTRRAATEVRRALGDGRSLHDLDAVARALPGSVHLTASMEGRTRSQGAVSTSRQIFHATVAGMTVAASNPASLAALIGSRLDEDTLALHLLTPGSPWPLSQRSMWSGVTELAVGCWLEVGPDGGGRTVRWWHPPEPAAPLGAAADAVRSAMLDAVRVRTQGGGTISADLSGGMDSTSLCFLTDAVGGNLLTHHWKPLDRANDDAAWAQRAAESLPVARHRFVEVDQAPNWFESRSQQDGTRDDIEGPPSWHRNRAHIEYLSEIDAAEGSTVHLTGLGGDELFGTLPTHLWSLFRKHPVTSISTIHRYRVVNRWALGATVRSLADTTTFAKALARAADVIDAPPPRPFDVLMGWQAEPRLPFWVTRDAVETVRRLLRESAGTNPSPLDPDRVQHQLIEGAVVSGGAIRQLRFALARFGVDWEAPFLDDRVIEAAMSVRVEDRAGRGLYKPVLVAAMRGIVPDEMLGRRSKGEYTAEAYEGLLRNRNVLLRLCDDLNLAKLGLVNADALRVALLNPGPESRDLNPFDNTLACETWLRSPSATAPQTALPSGEPR